MPRKDPVYLASDRNPAAPNCPVCGRLNDGFTEISKTKRPPKPKAGDASLCAYCGALCVFTADGGLRLPTVDESAKMMQDPMIRLLLSNLPVLPPPEGR